jgi:FkbM family methyltransferase
MLSALLYPTARNTYQRLLNREWWAWRQELKRRFRPFIRPGDLVFDIGANHGHYANDFAELGGRVVAVEPNPVLASEIRRNYGRRLLDVVCAAVGDEGATAELRLAGDDHHSTLNEEWRALSPETDWRGTIQVEVVTLDMLIERYGPPAFVKIDTEGYDAKVLRGLNYPVAGLCFEWVRDLPEMADACLARLAELGDYDITTPDAEQESDDIFARRR